MGRRKFLAVVGPGGAALLAAAEATGRVPEELIESVVAHPSPGDD